VTAEQPLLRVVRGAPTADELAALIAVVSARAGATAELDRPRSAWSDPYRRLRRPVPHGTGAWRRSALPG
jgi:hypothetical protein